MKNSNYIDLESDTIILLHLIPKKENVEEIVRLSRFYFNIELLNRLNDVTINVVAYQNQIFGRWYLFNYGYQPIIPIIDENNPPPSREDYRISVPNITYDITIEGKLEVDKSVELINAVNQFMKTYKK